MFANLSKGNIIYGLDRRDKIKVFTASVEQVSPNYRNQNNMFGQVPELRVDISVDINGEKKKFEQIPGNSAIADFGDKTFIIADNKESLYSGIKELLKTSEKIVESAPYHKTLIPQYKDALNEVMPGSVNNNDEVKALRTEVGSLKAQLAEAIALLKGEKQNKDS